MRLIILLFILISSCSKFNNDYYTSKQYKIKQRQEETFKMFDKTHDVRRKCAPRVKKHRSKRKKQYYD